MRGKERCRILKEIRQRIAEENDIEFITSECTHKGDCRGTCPKCESEVRFLERKLLERQRLGKSIAVAGIATGILLTSVGCSPEKESGSDKDVPAIERSETDGLIALPEDELMGEPIVEETAGSLTTEEDEKIPYIDENGDEQVVEITGDIAYPPIAGALPVLEDEECFFAEDIEEYEYYDAEFIERCLVGEHIDRIRHAWGEPDFEQDSSDGFKVSYFTDLRDIVLYIDLPSCQIARVEIIENE